MKIDILINSAMIYRSDLFMLLFFMSVKFFNHILSSLSRSSPHLLSVKSSSSEMENSKIQKKEETKEN